MIRAHSQRSNQPLRRIPQRRAKELLDHLQEQHELTQNEALDQLHAGMVRMREASVASRVPAVYHETAEEVKSNNNDDDTNKELVKV